ncbi:hypothetical protein FRC02_004075 [Tulasnella sp. 418]|nr:hypothetical protein FRC02_004075 [Tulasnella sp. 418]
MITTFVAAASILATSVAAQAFTPLASQHFEYTALPYKVDPNTGERGTQYGYNICNSTTEGPTSLCQTAFINSIDDFCVWGPPEPNSVVGNTEGEAVAWCTKPGHGTRVIPSGAITGVQFMRTPDYVQVTGFIKQDLVNMQADDGGGEMDPHGADQRGNPLGGVIFSNAWSGGGTNYKQVIEWHNFMGSGIFCLKACDPAGPNAAHYCEHVFDRIGCQYNAPAAYVDGVFESCLGDNQDFPGVYTGADGQVTTYSQPPESLGAIQSMPYTARIPASSSCTPYQSAQIFSGQPSATIPVVASSTAVTTPAGSATGGASSAAGGAARVTTSAKAAAAASASASSTASANGAVVQSGSLASVVFGGLLGLVALM